MDNGFDGFPPELRSTLSALAPMLPKEGPDPALLAQMMQLTQALPAQPQESLSRPAAMIGAALPFLAPGHRRGFYTMMKLMELTAYREETTLAAAEEGDLLSSLSPYLTPREKLQAELIARALRLRQE